MTKTFLKILAIALSIISVSNPSFAAITGYTGTIAYVTNEWEYPAYIVNLNGVTSNCSLGGFYILKSDVNYKEMVTNVLTAFAMGKSVMLFSDVNNTCVNGRVTIIGAQINN